MGHYYQPTTLTECLQLLENRRLTVIAGCTDVFPSLASQRAWGEAAPDDWLDVSAIEEIGGIRDDGDHYRIGSLVTWSELLRTPLPPYFEGLKAAAREIGGVQIQNRGTLVGNVCNASPAADGVPNLLCLDTKIELQATSGRRELPLGQFLIGNRNTARHGNELATALLVPKPADTARGHFFKLGARRYLVISIVMAAGVMATDGDGTIADIRIALGACSEVAQRLTELEQWLCGRPLKTLSTLSDLDARFFNTLSPIDDVRADGAYRKQAAREVTQRLLVLMAEQP